MTLVRRLEAAGVIAGYHAAMRWLKDEQAITASFLLSFDAWPCASDLDFIREQPEISKVWSFSGQQDAIADAMTTSPVALSSLVARMDCWCCNMPVNPLPILDNAK